MRRLLLAAVTATALAAPLAEAGPSRPCTAGWCIFMKGANVCYHEVGANGNWRTICVGADGYEACYYDFGRITCDYIL